MLHPPLPRVTRIAMLLLMSASVAVCEPGDFLSEILDERAVVLTQGWGALGIDTAVAPTDGRAPAPLRIGAKSYARGLGHHAPGEIVLDLAGEYSTFEAEVGVQAQDGRAGSVVFQVYVDGEKRFDSGVLRDGDPPLPLKVSTEKADTLRLVVTDAGDGITCDCANWCEARLVRKPGVKAREVEAASFDIAPFATVSAWDPKRMDGARNNRVQEFALEDLFLGTALPRKGGAYELAPGGDEFVCVGLEWPERRVLKELGIVFESDAPSRENARVDFWSGESPWQGKWIPFAGAIEGEGKSWKLGVNRKANPEFPVYGTEKVRWVFPATGAVRVASLSAFTPSRWDETELRVETARGHYEEVGRIAVYNGEFISGSETPPCLEWSWDRGNPVNLRVRYSRPRPHKGDRTVLSFAAPNGSFGLSVESLLERGQVYVRDLGVFVSLASNPKALEEVASSLESGRTVLERVREMPDQTFEAAMEHVHNPIQDLGPTLLSLACDNWKFAAHRDGKIDFNQTADDPHQSWGSWKPLCRMIPTFGALGTVPTEAVSRHLEGEWLPIPVIEVVSEGVTYRQRTCVAPLGKRIEGSPWLHERSVCVAEWTLENPSTEPREASLNLEFRVKGKQAVCRSSDKGEVVEVEGIPLAYVPRNDREGFTVSADQDVLRVAATLPAGGAARLALALPGWAPKPAEFPDLPATENLVQSVRSYWEEVLQSSAKIHIPDPFLENVIRASQVHCLLAARNDPTDGSVAAWISSDRYGPLESEAHSVILGMSRMGHEEFARRALDYFIKQYNAQGFLTTGYTLMGTGWHLWTLAEHFHLWRETDWLRRHASEVERVCRWIEAQRKKTMRLLPSGEKALEYGLFPPGVAADWNRFAYRFVLSAHYLAGLRDSARALAEIGRPESEDLLRSAEGFREDILRAYRRMVARTPAVPLSDGTFIPADPSTVYCFGPSGEGFPGEDGNRSWCYDVELGAHYLLALGVIEPQSNLADWMARRLEDDQFLRSGMGDYPEERNRADWFNLGGFSKVQPYYTRITELHSLRDDVKPFIRSYFNSIPSLLSRENLSFWEHFHNMGGWNKTHETGWFLAQTRTLFVMERGEELWLAPFVTTNWLKEGMEVAVEQAPTAFGTVSYRLRSEANEGIIRAEIQPPKRNPPKRIVLRVRHPEGKPIRSVEINGEPSDRFDPSTGTIQVLPTVGVARADVRF